jgi:hypothetical protein
LLRNNLLPDGLDLVSLNDVSELYDIRKFEWQDYSEAALRAEIRTQCFADDKKYWK